MLLGDLKFVLHKIWGPSEKMADGVSDQGPKAVETAGEMVPRQRFQ
jgi:hypothetical protein